MNNPPIPHGRIVELARRITTQCEELERRLSEHNLPYPSFPSASYDFPPSFATTQHTILEATDELTALVQGPKNILSSFATEHNKSTSLHAILRFSLPIHIPLTGSIPFTSLASLTRLSTPTLTQLLRHAMTYRIFHEPVEGFVAHTPASKLLLSDTNLVNFIRVALDELLPAAANMVDAMEKWPESGDPCEAGFQLANRTGEAMFEVLDKEPGRAERFALSMRGFLDSEAFSAGHLAGAYAWGERRKIVDVGGSSGTVARYLAERFPALECVVQDLPRTVGSCIVGSTPGERVRFMAHDMFGEQPVTDADVYLIRFVLHDWSDEYAARIIRRVVPMLEKGAELVINDTCLPEYGTMSAYDQRFLRATSLTMRAIQNGRERDLEDWKNLLSRVDERLVVKDLVRPKGSALSVLVVVLQM